MSYDDTKQDLYRTFRPLIPRVDLCYGDEPNTLGPHPIFFKQPPRFNLDKTKGLWDVLNDVCIDAHAAFDFPRGIRH